MNVDEVGEYLEHQGFSDTEIDDIFLEHFGVKGMKWGQRRAESRAARAEYMNKRAQTESFGNRNNKRAQRNIDRTRRIASGKATLGDKAFAVAFTTPVGYIIKEGGLRNASAYTLDRAQRAQTKTLAGKKRLSDALNRAGGVNIRTLDFSYDNG